MQWYDANLVQLQSVMVYILLGLSLQVVLRAGIFSMASIGFFGVGAYGAAILANDGHNVVISVGVPVVVGFVGGALLALVVVKLRGLYLGLVTLAFTLILSVLEGNGGELTGGAIGLYGIPQLAPMPLLVSVVLVVILLVSQLQRGGVGRSLDILRLNEDLARSLGFDPIRRRNLLMSLSSGLGALAGSLHVLCVSYVSPGTADFGLVVVGLTLIVVGGMNSWVGAIVGAVFVVWLPVTMGSTIGPWGNLIFGAAVVLVATFAPDGIVGIVSRLVAFIRKTWLTGEAYGSGRRLSWPRS
jgi:branched-chain amino acid transport system permease protein